MSTGTAIAADAAVFEFSEANQRKIETIVAKYPAGKQASAVLPLLMLAQDQNGGWLPQPALDAVADRLEMPPIRVYEVATFYTMFNLKPVGRHHVQVCTNLPCWLRGSDAIVDTCRHTLGVELGETTSDGGFTLSEVECLGACVNAPMMQIGHDYFEDLTPDATKEILETLRQGGAPKPGSCVGRKSSEPLGFRPSAAAAASGGGGDDGKSEEA